MPYGPLKTLLTLLLLAGSTAHADALSELERIALSLENTTDESAQASLQDQMAMLPLQDAQWLQCALECESTLARAWSAHCTGYLPGLQSQNILLSALQDSSSKVRREALEGLAKIGDRTSIQSLMKAAAREKDPSLQSLAQQASQQIIARSRHTTGSTDWSGFNAPDAMDRKAALELAGKSENWRLLLQLTEATQDHHPAVREAAIHALGKLGDDRALHTLHRLILKETGRTRHAAIGALAHLANSQSLPHLSPLAHSEDTGTRRYVARALGWISSPGTMEPLAHLAKDPTEAVRTEVILSIGKIGPSLGGPILVQFLEDEVVFLRSEAARLLAGSAPEVATAPLISALSDKDPLVRINAANSLGALGSTQAIDALERQFQKAKNPEEAAYYRNALGLLGAIAPE
jgi:HEAT repeat protein